MKSGNLAKILPFGDQGISLISIKPRGLGLVAKGKWRNGRDSNPTASQINAHHHARMRLSGHLMCFNMRRFAKILPKILPNILQRE